MSAQFDPRITAYFGDAVMQAGFMPLPHLFLRHYRTLGLTHVQAMFVLQLMEIAWDVGDPPNNVTRLAERMGVSARTIRQCSQEVHALGLVEIYDQFDEGGAQVENGYDLCPLFRRLAELAPAPLPSGQLRERRSRPKMAPSEDDSVVLPPPPLQDLAPPPPAGFRTPPLRSLAAPPCKILQGLKRKIRISLRNRQENNNNRLVVVLQPIWIQQPDWHNECRPKVQAGDRFDGGLHLTAARSRGAGKYSIALG